MPRTPPRWAFVLASLAGTLLYLGVAAIGWGGIGPLLANPARATLVVTSLVLTVVALASPINMSPGTREDVGDRRIFAPLIAGSLLAAWLTAFLDRRDTWVIDGDAARWLGVALLVAGGILRVWPMFVLGHRFSGLVAIQPGHLLETSGPYRWIRHPSYLGGLLAFAGWVLAFRSVAGLVLLVPGFLLVVVRIDDEEALLAQEFGRPYAEYRARTWKLVPGLY